MLRTHLWLAVSIVAASVATVSGCSCSQPPVSPKLKALGVPCAADTECELGLCDAIGGGDKVCLKPCSEGCETTDVCTGLGDDRFTCAPEKAGLCQACETSADCAYPADECLVLGDSRFCGRDCAFDTKCPDSFKCAPGTTTAGAIVQHQCQPKSGTCECTAASAGQELPCENNNNFGHCTGVKTCVPNTGYDTCTARVPGAETCNGIDDDCNGQTDENLGDEACGLGECARTVSRCVNGQPQSCLPGDAGVESCNGKDDDCDGTADEDFNLQTNVNNCGSCGNVCVLPHAVPVCTGGMCAIGSCVPGWVDVNGVPTDGCEYPCAPTGAEVCDNKDNDCNGLVDDGFSKQTDVNNCGSCGTVCAPQNATGACNTGNCAIGSCNVGFENCNTQYVDGCEIHTTNDVNHCGSCTNVCNLPHAGEACASSTCVVTSCDPGYQNCNGQNPDGCEINTVTDVNNCGGCGNVCSFANAAPACASGTCAFACLPNFWDLDGNAANGCEYACTRLSDTDLPDMSFVDANCDGIDGEAGNAVFVSPSGADGNPGTRASPRRTISAGVSAATLQGKRDVLVASGPYAETVNVVNGKSVYGGYDPVSWSRNNSGNTSVNATGTALVVSNSNNSVIQFIGFFGGSATGSSNTAYGAQVINSSGVTLERLTIQAGNGSDGANGAAGATGTGGTAGLAGKAGCEDSNFPCTSCSQPTGGAGGTSACGRTGGTGGSAGKGSSTGGNGGVGVGGTAGGPGVPPNGGASDPGLGYAGSNGTSGGTGGAGTNGSGMGTLASTGYVVASSSSGSAGGHGNGGGGGGGGGGGTIDCNSYGSGGGGGGAGGCGGGGGGRGTSGGASIGLFLYGTNTSPTSVDGISLLITTGKGGNGGNGAGGGTGGTGGGRGPLGPYGGGSEQDDASTGAKGGMGGNGGDGGRGGSGGGGPVVGVAKGGTSTWNATNVTYTLGVAGNGGSNGVTTAANGQSANTL